MVMACLAWAVCQRAGRNFTGGLLLAAGCALKLAPIALIPYLAIRRDWRGLAGVILGGALVVLVPAPWIGLDGTARLHLDWFRHARETQDRFQNYRVGNQGLMGMLSRLPPISNGAVCYSDENMAALEEAYPFLVAGLAAALYGWIVWDLRTRSQALAGEQRRQREQPLLDLAVCLHDALPSFRVAVQLRLAALALHGVGIPRLSPWAGLCHHQGGVDPARHGLDLADAVYPGAAGLDVARHHRRDDRSRYSEGENRRPNVAVRNVAAARRLLLDGAAGWRPLLAEFQPKPCKSKGTVNHKNEKAPRCRNIAGPFRFHHPAGSRRSPAGLGG